MASSRHPHPSRQPAHAIRGGTPPAFQVRALALTIGCALAGLTTTALLSPGAAQAAESAASQAYAIPAGRLSDVLARFAATAGVQLVFGPQMLAGLNSPGLRGSYTVQEGFARLLAGSGYELAEAGNGGYALRKAAAPAPRNVAPADSGAMNLPTITVMAQAERTGVTEGSGSYMARSSIYNKGQGLRETPQSVSIMTSQRIQDQSLTTLESAMEQTRAAIAWTWPHACSRRPSAAMR